MARYIKANLLVATFLHLEKDRNTVKDGNYLLWQNDMLAFGPLTELSETLKKIGGIALLAHEAREEQDGTVIRPLPVAEDPRFVVEAKQDTESDENNAGDEVTEGDAETPTEATETATGEAEEQTGEAVENEETNNEQEA